MTTLFQDTSYGCRMLLTKRGFTIAAVLSLALGIGANTTIFSVINGTLGAPGLQPFPGLHNTPAATLLGPAIFVAPRLKRLPSTLGIVPSLIHSVIPLVIPYGFVAHPLNPGIRFFLVQTADNVRAAIGSLRRAA